MNELAIIEKYTQKPVHKLANFTSRAGSSRDIVRAEEIIKALKRGNLAAAERHSILGYETNPDPTGIISRLFNAVRISINEAKRAIKRFRENKKLGSDAVIRSAVPISHTIRQIGETPIVNPPFELGKFNKKYVEPLSKGRISNTYALPTGAMSRISGAIALLKGIIQKQDVFMLETIKKKLSTGKVKAALVLCREQERLTMNEGRIDESKAWKRLYNSIKGN